MLGRRGSPTLIDGRRTSPTGCALARATPNISGISCTEGISRCYVAGKAIVEFMAEEEVRLKEGMSIERFFGRKERLTGTLLRSSNCAKGSRVR